MTPKRKFSSFGYVHIFQITADRGVCFYSAADCLVWFTKLCILAVKYDVKILAVCIMLNHFHIEARFSSFTNMFRMMQELDSWFTVVYNREQGRSGALFQGKYGSAIKFKANKIRENFIYIGNNPVVKKAVSKAEDYRWNFLKYAREKHPFSEKIGSKGNSRALLCALAEIRRCRTASLPISYSFFRGIYQQLERRERLQVLDYIVAQYDVIDHSALLNMWGGYKQMCSALHTVSGAEYDLKDDTASEDYRHYFRMIDLAHRHGIRLGWSCPESVKKRLARLFQDEVGASALEISKLLHI